MSTDDPDDIVAWKVATIADPITLRFNGYSWGSYGPTGTSRCLFTAHRSPTYACRCGFHAYRRRSDATNKLDRRRNAVLLRVALYGTVVEHTSGWRAEQQDVIGVHLPSVCARRRCGTKVTELRSERAGWVAVCASHGGDGSVSLEAIRRSTGVDIVCDL